MNCRTPNGGVRGVVGAHNRVFPATDAEFERLVHAEGLPAPWHGQHDETPLESPILAFCHAMIHVGRNGREVFFARLQGLEWHEIGDAIIGNATPQAAQKVWAETLARFPALGRAFKTTEKD